MSDGCLHVLISIDTGGWRLPDEFKDDAVSAERHLLVFYTTPPPLWMSRSTYLIRIVCCYPLLPFEGASHCSN